MTEGFVFTEFIIAAADRERMAGWHSREHIAERLETGVASAARYVDIGDELHFCAIYRAPSVDVFGAPAYAALASSASAVTRQISAGVKGTRFIGEVVADVGIGQGGIFTGAIGLAQRNEGRLVPMGNTGGVLSTARLSRRVCR